MLALAQWVRYPWANDEMATLSGPSQRLRAGAAAVDTDAFPLAWASLASDGAFSVHVRYVDCSRRGATPPRWKTSVDIAACYASPRRVSRAQVDLEASIALAMALPQWTRTACAILRGIASDTQAGMAFARRIAHELVPLTLTALAE